MVVLPRAAVAARGCEALAHCCHYCAAVQVNVGVSAPCRCPAGCSRCLSARRRTSCRRACCCCLTSQVRGCGPGCWLRASWLAPDQARSTRRHSCGCTLACTSPRSRSLWPLQAGANCWPRPCAQCPHATLPYPSHAPISRRPAPERGGSSSGGGTPRPAAAAVARRVRCTARKAAAPPTAPGGHAVRDRCVVVSVARHACLHSAERQGAAPPAAPGGHAVRDRCAVVNVARHAAPPAAPGGYTVQDVRAAVAATQVALCCAARQLLHQLLPSAATQHLSPPVASLQTRRRGPHKSTACAAWLKATLAGPHCLTLPT